MFKVFRLNVVLGCVSGLAIGLGFGTLLPDSVVVWPALIPGCLLLLWVLAQLRRM